MRLNSMWQIKRLTEMTSLELYQILKLRTATFVVEQKRIYQEVDDRDLEAIHVFAKDRDQVTAYSRIYLIDQGSKVTFGRVVIAKALRGQGLGEQLLNQIMKVIKTYFAGKPIEIESQIQVQNFYKQKGFVAEGQEFIFESTPHIKLVHPPMTNP